MYSKCHRLKKLKRAINPICNISMERVSIVAYILSNVSVPSLIPFTVTPSVRQSREPVRRIV